MRAKNKRTIAHVWCTATVHINGFEIGSREAEVSKLDDDFPFLRAVRCREPTVRDNEVLWLDIAMKDLLGMTGSDGFTHLSKHGRDETKAGT